VAETTSFVYDFRGLETSRTLPDTTVISRAYNRLGRQISQTDPYSVTTFTYDNLNRRVKTANGLGLVEGLGYDLRDRTMASTNSSFTHSYDLNGNRTGKLQSGSVFYAYDDENQLISAMTDTAGTGTANRWKTEWTYDARGRARTRLDYNWTTTWNLQATTRYLYDGRRVIQERNSSNLPLVSYVRGLDLSGSLEGAGGIGGLLARVAHSGANGATLTPAYYHADGNGNITKLIDAAQISVADYKYDPFGRTITSSGTLASANVYQFSSKELMTKSGFYYYGFRFYDPDTGRWLNRNRLGERRGLNLYGFVGNDGIDKVDSDGRMSFVLRKIIKSKIRNGGDLGGKWLQPSRWELVGSTPNSDCNGNCIDIECKYSRTSGRMEDEIGKTQTRTTTVSCSEVCPHSLDDPINPNPGPQGPGPIAY
jgi:RHS repeat-associated protein